MEIQKFMSQEQRQQIGAVVNWTLKIILGLAAFLAAYTFNNSQSTLTQIQADVKELSKVMIKLEGHLERVNDRVDRNSEDIKDLKTERR